MTTIKPIHEWRRIMLDTSVIIDLFKDPARFSKQPDEQLRITRTQQLIEVFNSAATGEKIPAATFIISAISLAELIKLPEKDSAIAQIASILNSSDVLVADFTATHARTISERLDTFLSQSQKFQLFSQLEKDLKAGGVSWARQWISDDLKIAATAATQKNLDALLTADGKTFFAVAQAMQLPCVNTNKLPTDLFGNLNTFASFS